MKTGIVVAASLLLAIGSAVAQGRKAPKPDATPPPEPPPAESPPESGKKTAALTFDQLDLDKDGGVTWDEFLKAHVAAAGRNAADPHAAVMPAKDLKRLQRIFREADNDGSGILLRKEWDDYPRK